MGGKDLRDKIIILTGASDGIGREIAYLLGEEGATVVLAARTRDRLEEVAEHMRTSGGTALVVPTDISDFNQISKLVRTALEKYERIDILLNVAGLGYFDWTEEITAEELRQQYEVNILAMAELCRQVIPTMKEQRSGHIVNMTSYASRVAVPPMTIYCSTKYAIEGLTDGLRRELAPWNIKVTRVHPDAVDNDFNMKAAQSGGVRYPFSKLTGVTSQDVAQKVVKVLKKPRRAVYVSRIPFLSNLIVFVNRQLPFLLDLVFKPRVRKMWKEHTDHDLAEDLVVYRQRQA